MRTVAHDAPGVTGFVGPLVHHGGFGHRCGGLFHHSGLSGGGLGSGEGHGLVVVRLIRKPTEGLESIQALGKTDVASTQFAATTTTAMPDMTAQPAAAQPAYQQQAAQQAYQQQAYQQQAYQSTTAQPAAAQVIDDSALSAFYEPEPAAQPAQAVAQPVQAAVAQPAAVVEPVAQAQPAQAVALPAAQPAVVEQPAAPVAEPTVVVGPAAALGEVLWQVHAVRFISALIYSCSCLLFPWCCSSGPMRTSFLMMVSLSVAFQ